jgi:hypothetical protein
MRRTRDGMKGEMDRRTIHGSGAFVEKLNKECGIDEVIKPQGRPRKAKK